MRSSGDIWFCAFVKMKGIELHSYKVISRGKVTCNYDVSDEKWMELKVEFNNSDLSKFKVLIEQVKDLGY